MVTLVQFPDKIEKKEKKPESFRSMVQSNLFNTDTAGQNQESALQRCPYYRGRERVIFGISGIKRTVRNREVSVS